MTPRLSSLLALMLLCSPTAAPADVSALAKRFAPVIVQQQRGRADLLAALDYDGNWNGRDNWENLEEFPQKAVVYAHTIETSTHAYLLYAFFHPRDWSRVNVLRVNHENDLDGALVVVAKGLGERVLLVETTGTGPLERYSSDAGLATDGVKGHVKLEGERPVVHLRAFDHAATMWRGRSLRTEKGTIYRYRGKAETPGGGNERDVGYDLQDLAEVLWARRYEVGGDALFATPAAFPGGTWGSTLNGDNMNRTGGDAPWMWGTNRRLGILPGDWFLDPARAMRIRYPHQADRFATGYAVHPYKKLR